MFDRSNGLSLRSGFLRNSILFPDAPAIVVGGITRSYGELEQRARRWAGAIIDACGSRPERVGLFASRSEVAYTGTLAALLSGAAFVPLNPTFPPEKTASMIRQAEPDAIIVDRASARQVSEVLSGVDAPPLLVPELESPHFPGVSARALGRHELDRARPLSGLPPVTPDDIAYLLFTSGSTGTPKGVPVTHGNVNHFIDVMMRRYDLQQGHRFSQSFDQTFDPSVFDLFMAWSSGGCVYAMTPAELLAPTGFINKHQISVWFSVPSVPAHMSRRGTLKPHSMTSLRWSLFAGEPLPRRLAEAWQEAAPNSMVENLYGPTELTITCFVHRWNSLSSPAQCRNDIVPIGRPLDGLAALVVDEHLAPVSAGETGELCVTGPQTTPGYWRDAAKTAEKYVDLPVCRAQTRRFYRTGDRAARLPSGEYMFFGRADEQIKILGHRTELGEIEAALRRAPGVEHAVALGWPAKDGSAEGVVAFVSGSGLNTEALGHLARAALPPWAVPQRFFMVPNMPLNSNGKIDRNALRNRLVRPDEVSTA
jgi:amino acid adenylation domain-containing protein